MIGPDFRIFRDGTREFCQNLAMEGDAARIGNAPVFVRSIQVAAAVFRDLDDRVVLFPRDLHRQIMDPCRPYLQTRVGERTFGRHLDVHLSQRIATRRAAFAFRLSAEMARRA